MKNKKHLHVIGIGGIGVSALARYYKSQGYSVSGSDGSDSVLIDTLRNEGMNIHIGHSAGNIPDATDLVIYSEAIITKPDLSPEEQIYSNPELARARELGIKHISYPVALGEVFNNKKGIAVTGSHGKSTTTAMIATMMAGSSIGVSAIIGTQVPGLGNSNFYHEPSDYFVIEACEYKRSFLHYHPYITIITNIDLDHLDYYKSLEDYISAFQSIIDQTIGFVIISADDVNSLRLQIPEEKKIIVGNKKVTYFPRVEENIDGTIETYYVEKELEIPSMNLQVPGDHLLHDAHLAYTAGKLCGLESKFMVQKLNNYTGSWRRSEIIGTTENGNILMSDYGHHPSEIIPTLSAIKSKYCDKQLYVVFQPHQYSRTRELLGDFATAFSSADILVIPDIYFSRDKKEDVEWMTTERLIDAVKSEKGRVKKGAGETIINGNGLENTAKMIQEYDEQNPNSSVILLLGAGDVDNLRYEIM